MNWKNLTKISVIKPKILNWISEEKLKIILWISVSLFVVILTILGFSLKPDSRSNEKEEENKGEKWTYCYESPSRGHTVCGKVSSLSLSSKEQQIVQMGVYFPDTGVNALFYKKGERHLYHNTQGETGEWFLEKTKPLHYVGWVREDGSKKPLKSVLSKK